MFNEYIAKYWWWYIGLAAWLLRAGADFYHYKFIENLQKNDKHLMPENERSFDIYNRLGWLAFIVWLTAFLIHN